MRWSTRKILMSSEDSRVYVFMEIQPGKEKEFSDEVLSKD